MSTERINQLHEEASERYLNGDYAGAIKAWSDVLGLDPHNEQAQESVRMASQFVQPDAAVSTAAPASSAAVGSDVEHELERGLKVLDGLDVSTLLEHDGEEGATDRPPAPEGVAELSSEEGLEGWDTPHPVSSEDESFGLEPMQAASQMPSSQMSAAGAELKRRVDDLLSQAKAKAEAGERDEALAVLARLSILDEDNAEAAELRAKIEAAGASDLDKVERSIIEGVSALEADQLDEAERHFQEALAVAPDHREAKHYMEKVAERRSAGEDDLLGGPVGESAPAEDAVPRALPAESEPQKQAPAAKPPRATVRANTDVFDPPPAASAPRVSLPAPKILLVGAVGVVVLVLAVIALPRMFGGSHPSAPPKAAAPAPRPARPAKGGPAGGGGVAPIKTSGPEASMTVASALQSGRERMASGDFGAAVLAYNQALALDPANAEAKAGFDDARDRYTASKAERDALNTIKLAFRDGEFTSGLRLAYRLPPTVSKTYSDRVKLAGWYNLAVVALRAGDCKGALTQIDEALQIDPEDPGAQALKELATRYVEAVKDRSFLDRVEALAFRSPPES